MIHHHTRSFSHLLADCHVIAQQRQNPGLLFLTQSLSVIHMNQEAKRIIGRVRAARDGKGSDGRSSSGSLPKPIFVFAKLMQTRLHEQSDTHDWDHLQLKHVIELQRRIILIRGWALHAHPPARRRSFLIILEPITVRRESSSDSLLPTGHFTPRERSILRLLSSGHSNSAIAGNLGLSIHTVKDRLKVLMAKTQTTTRTGLLAYLLKTNGSFPLEGTQKKSGRSKPRS